MVVSEACLPLSADVHFMSLDNESGLTVLEMMLAMSLGAWLLLTLVMVLSDLSRNLQWQQAITDVMDRESWLVQWLPKRVQQSGLSDCVTQGKKQAPYIQGFGRHDKSPRWLTQQKPHTDAMIISGCRRYRGRQQWIKTAYYIAKTHYYDVRNKPVYAVYQKVEGGRREALVSGIEDWSIRYAIHSVSVSQRSQWVTAQSIDDWHQVAMVSFNIILQARFQVRSVQTVYSWLGRTYTVPQGEVLTSLPITMALREP